MFIFFGIFSVGFSYTLISSLLLGPQPPPSLFFIHLLPQSFILSSELFSTRSPWRVTTINECMTETGVTLEGSRSVSNRSLSVVHCCLMYSGISNSVPNKSLHLLPTPNLLVCCIFHLGAWHNHPTHHLRLPTFLTTSAILIIHSTFCWFYLSISQICHHPHILIWVVLSVIK